MSNLKKKLDNLINKKKTLLGVGPMSANVIDSSIELSNKFKAPIMLIASRRQIEAEEFGGGYVNNWNTKEYSNYVLKNNKSALPL